MPIVLTSGEIKELNIALIPKVIPPPPGVGSIEGWVVDAATNQAIRYYAYIKLAGMGISKQQSLAGGMGYQFTNLPLGSYTLTAEAEGYETQSRDVKVVAEYPCIQIFRLLLVAPGSLWGYVTARDTKQPMAGVNVEILLTHEIRPSSITDSSGRYEITNLPPGSYSVTAEIEGVGYSLRITGTTIRANKTTRLDIELIPSLTPKLYGWVADERAYGIANALVEILETGQFTYTYSDGSYEIPEVRVVDSYNYYTVQASASGYITKEVRQRFGDLSLVQILFKLQKEV